MLQLVVSRGPSDMQLDAFHLARAAMDTPLSLLIHIFSAARRVPATARDDVEGVGSSVPLLIRKVTVSGSRTHVRLNEY